MLCDKTTIRRNPHYNTKAPQRLRPLYHTQDISTLCSLHSVISSEALCERCAARCIHLPSIMGLICGFSSSSSVELRICKLSANYYIETILIISQRTHTQTNQTKSQQKSIQHTITMPVKATETKEQTNQARDEQKEQVNEFYGPSSQNTSEYFTIILWHYALCPMPYEELCVLILLLDIDPVNYRPHYLANPCVVM